MRDEVPEVQIDLVEPVRPVTTPTRAPASELLSEHGLSIGFLVAVALGIWISISVLKLALSESRLAGQDSARARRCFQRQARALKGMPGFSAEDLPTGSDTMPLRREAMAALAGKGRMRGGLLCPDQGPMLRPDDVHFELVHLEDDAVELRCRRHGAIPPEELPSE